MDNGVWPRRILVIGAVWTLACYVPGAAGANTAPHDDADPPVQARTPAGTARPPGSPCPPSTLLAGITWRWQTHRTAAHGSDLWPVTWGPDDQLYTAWGDGGGFGGSDSDGRVSMGFARIDGGPTDFCGININGGKDARNPPAFPRHGKTGGILFVDGTLWASVNLQDAPWPDVDHQLAWSRDSGATWSRADWVFAKGVGHFQPARFLNFGRNYTGVPAHLDGFVYLYGPKQPRAAGQETDLFLARVPKPRLAERAAYEYFAGRGAGGQPQWSADSRRLQPIFTDPHGVTAPSVVWNPGLHRFLLTSFHMGPGQLGLFDGPEPWGPWTTVAYYEDWGQMGTAGEGLTCDFPAKWMSPDGRTLWSIFSAYGAGAKQGVAAHDRFNLVQAILQVRPAPSSALEGGR